VIESAIGVSISSALCVMHTLVGKTGSDVGAEPDSGCSGVGGLEHATSAHRCSESDRTENERTGGTPIFSP
jgi:hypothetical protein